MSYLYTNLVNSLEIDFFSAHIVIHWYTLILYFLINIQYMYSLSEYTLNPYKKNSFTPIRSFSNNSFAKAKFEIIHTTCCSSWSQNFVSNSSELIKRYICYSYRRHSASVLMITLWNSYSYNKIDKLLNQSYFPIFVIYTFYISIVIMLFKGFSMYHWYQYEAEGWARPIRPAIKGGRSKPQANSVSAREAWLGSSYLYNINIMYTLLQFRLFKEYQKAVYITHSIVEITDGLLYWTYHNLFLSFTNNRNEIFFCFC